MTGVGMTMKHFLSLNLQQQGLSKTYSFILMVTKILGFKDCARLIAANYVLLH